MIGHISVICFFMLHLSDPYHVCFSTLRSGSSHGQALELMKIATKTMIDTLGEDDFVLLAHFPVKIEDENVTGTGCAHAMNGWRVWFYSI